MKPELGTHPLPFAQVWRAAMRRLEKAGVEFGQGTEDAAQEAGWMLIHCLDLPLLESFAQWDALQPRQVPAAAQQRLLELLQRRIDTRKPLAYLLGEAWLRGHRFVVDERAIVPRSLIAELLDHALEPWLERAPRRIADVCTGNGSLAVLAALRWPEAEVWGVDISPEALEVARLNVALHGVQGRVRLLQSDLMQALPAQRDLDLVLCNPPYVNAASMRALPREFQHEPELALAGGADGMDLVRRLFQQAPRHLAPHGVMVVEIGHERAHFEAAFPALPVTWLEVSAGADAVFVIEAAALAQGR